MIAYLSNHYASASCLVTLLIEGKRSAYRWLKNNSPYKKTNHPFFLKNISQISQSIDLSSLEYLYNRKATIGEVALKKEVKKNGYCHGQCVALVKLLLETPSLTCDQLIFQLYSSSTTILFFQYIEILRTLCPEASIGSIRLPPVQIPQKKETLQYSHLNDRINQLLEHDGDEHIWILRCWNTKKLSTAHSLVFCSTVHHQCFYNSKVGFYSFPTKDALYKSFIDHLKATMQPIFNHDWMVHLEKY